ncbi:NAD(P)/FAD-dependent oxidoreductase [Polynucleobacter paneuropaeus]|uniref:NAD(P)/FAD-dependent oxidoreductase n=1 Tax=Polynucleobacter paneuropaeus TaxID=2527775 RepID=A0A9Q2ZWS0_9BURK|nr:NAD(P)/FAD-dependent oxidoreductase [Polynucleobacter paneuropaeus]
MTFKVDAVIIGSGVVGLACARKLASAGLETMILESRPTFGQGTSSRNSEVIHAGLYYLQNSLKAHLCVEGRRALYLYCDQRRIPYQKIGKWIVASTPDQLERLEEIRLQAKTNGCPEVHYLSSQEISSQEPQLNCLAALCSPETGIIDSHSLMMALLADVENAGGQIIFNAPVSHVNFVNSQIQVAVGGSEPTTLTTNYLINSAGLQAVPLLSEFEGFPKKCIPEYCYVKGNYFSLHGRSPFSRLIYPTPEVAGLGVHFTLDMAGGGKFGPDVEWIEDENYIVNPARSTLFYNAIKSYWPDVALDRLQPAYSGIRPKLGLKGNLYSDFLIQTEQDHEISGLINLLGIDSPGLTSCLAIADYVVERLGI